MPQDSISTQSSHNRSTESDSNMSGCSVKTEIEQDLSGNFFVLKEQIDVKKYHHWLKQSPEKVTEEN